MKKLLTLFALLTLALNFTPVRASSLDVLPVMSSISVSENRVWVGTFQLVWNDLSDNLVKGAVKFYGKTPANVKLLNKKSFNADMISENSYYKTFGTVSPELKNTIEQAIKEKFNETSSILNSFDWTTADNKYLFYAMLKKNFKFTKAFDKLNPEPFGKNFNKKTAYFGITKKSSKELDSCVNVLFYNSPSDFAVSLPTEEDDIVYLYRTSDNKTFDKLYSDMNLKSKKYDGSTEFLKDDELKVPDIDLNVIKSFDELTDKRIKRTSITIDKALETIEFKMNNEGVELKSEAALAAFTSMPLPYPVARPRYFYFNDTFVIFLQEKGKALPYFALRVNDIDAVNNAK